MGANPLVGLSRPQVAAALGRLLQRVAVEPGVAAATTLGAVSQLLEVLVGRSDVAPAPGDKRFTDPAWSYNPVYRRLLQAYLVEARAVLGVVDGLELDAKSRERARFAVSLLTEAVAPTNTLLGNPSALAKAVQTRGRSLVEGAPGTLPMTCATTAACRRRSTAARSESAATSPSPGQVVHRGEVFELIQYRRPARRPTPARWWRSRRRSTSSTSPTSPPAAA